MKPDWSHAPKWANWLALDGKVMGPQRWYWYAEKPDWHADVQMWIPPIEKVCEVAGVSGEGNPEDTLEERR